jgi:hypothetical protein
MPTQKEMPKWQGVRQVYALKISKVIQPSLPIDGDLKKGTIEFENKEYAPLKLEYVFFKKHEPKEGGYYVVYENGHTSYCPGPEFEKINFPFDKEKPQKIEFRAYSKDGRKMYEVLALNLESASAHVNQLYEFCDGPETVMLSEINLIMMVNETSICVTF